MTYFLNWKETKKRWNKAICFFPKVKAEWLWPSYKNVDNNLHTNKNNNTNRRKKERKKDAQMNIQMNHAILYQNIKGSKWLYMSVLLKWMNEWNTYFVKKHTDPCRVRTTFQIRQNMNFGQLTHTANRCQVSSVTFANFLSLGPLHWNCIGAVTAVPILEIINFAVTLNRFLDWIVRI